MTGKQNPLHESQFITILALFLLSACTIDNSIPIELTKPTIEDDLLQVTETIPIIPTETQMAAPIEIESTETPLPIIGSSKLILLGFKEEKWEVYTISLPCWDLDFSCSLEYDNQLLVDVREYWNFWNLDISPSGTKALFVSDIRNPNRNGDLYVTELGTETYRLVSAVGSIKSAIWSPDGNQITFISNVEGKHLTHLHIVTEDGINDTLLPTPNEINTFPSWSPSGDKIAFYSKGEGTENNDYLYTIDLETNEIVKLTEFAVSATTLPRWSPDGKKIAFLVKDNYQEDICIVDTQTLERTCFFTDESWDKAPEWSSDGAKIYYGSNHNLHGSGIFIRTLKTGEVIKISQYEGFYFGPILSPDGSYIACDVLIGEQWYPHLIAADGSWEIQLADVNYDIYANQFLP